MALRQTMNLSQNLVITPQLQQAIKLLQMSRLELESQVRNELEENPIANARLMLLPSPTRIVLVVGKKKKIVWSADAK